MVLQRHEINEKDTWDLSTIYPTDQAWEEALKDLTEKVQTAAQYEGHLLDSADSLLEITEFSLDLERQVEKLYVYAHMKNDQDTREAKYQEYYAKAMTLYSQLEQAFLTSSCKRKTMFFRNVRKNCLLEQEKSLALLVKPSLFWTMRILASHMSLMTKAMKCNSHTVLTSV